MKLTNIYTCWTTYGGVRQQLNRGRNDLLEQAYKDLGRAAFHRELIVVAVCVIAMLVLGVFA